MPLEVKLCHPSSGKYMTEVLPMFRALNWPMNHELFVKLGEKRPDTLTFLISKDSEDLLGVYSLIPFQPGEYHFGYLLIKESVRRKGLGSRVLKEFVNAVNFRSLVLLCLADTKELYSKLGMVELPSRNLRKLHVQVVPTFEASNSNTFRKEQSDISIKPMKESRFKDFISYDTSARGFDTSLLDELRVETHTVILAENTNTGRIVGYATGYLLDNQGMVYCDGLVADSEGIARGLIWALMKEYPLIQKMRFNSRANRVTFFSSLGDVVHDEDITCLYFGTPTVTPQEHVYAVGDLSLNFM